MTRSREQIEIIECRNMLLSTLQAVYPNSFSTTNLHRAMVGTFPALGMLHLRTDLHYLAAKAYIEEADPGLGKQMATTEFPDKRWKLTAAGVEIAQKITDDPALEI